MDDSHTATIQREKALFMQALEIESSDEQARFLKEACGDDPVLRKRLEHLLEINATQDGPIDPSRYDSLLTEQERLTQELVEEGRFLSELGHSIRCLGEDYELIEEIGRGSAGVVYRARQMSLSREVAVKVIHGSALASEAERERFQVEVEAAASLKHPNIMPVYEIGRHGIYDFFSMPLMSGGTLSTLISNTRLSVRDTVVLLVKICRTIHAAHRGGVIHRDLKPDNILLDEAGEPHISDFGLAYRLEHHPALTMTCGIVGTPYYMAPEQADSQIGPVTTATDVYSLGVILYQMLTGHQPFRHDSLLRVLEMVKAEPPRSPRSLKGSIGRDLETIVLKCMEKQPAARYESALALAEDLEAWLDHRPIMARPASTPTRLWKWSRRRPAHAMLVLISSLFVLTLGIGGPLIALQQLRYSQVANQARAIAEQERLISEQQRQAAGRAAFENRALAYAYSTRLAAAVANTDRKSLASHGLLRSLVPAPGESDTRGWEWYYLFAEVYLESRRLEGNGMPVETLSFSPSGQLVAVSQVGRDGTRLQDGLHAATVRDLNDPGAKHLAYVWRQDESQIFTLSDRGEVTVWDPQSGWKLENLHTDESVISLGGWQGDGLLVGLTSDNAVRTWDVSDLSETTELQWSQLSVPGLKQIMISPDGRYLAGITGDSNIYLWTMDGLDESPVVLSGHTDSVTGMDWHRDSRWLATLSEDQVMRVWEVPSGTRHLNVAKTLTRLTAVCWDPNGLQLMFAGGDGFLWHFDNVRSQLSRVNDYEPAITSLDWSGATFSYAIGFADGSVEMNRRGLPETSRLIQQEQGVWSSICWSADGSAIGGFVADGTLRFLDSLTGEIQNTSIDAVIPPSFPEGWQPPDVTLEPGTFAWHAASNRVATGNADGSVSVWDANRDERIAHFQTPSSTAPHVAWHPDGARLASAGDDKALHLWDWELGETVLSLNPGHHQITELAWSPEGMRLAAAVRAGGIWVWDATAGYLMNGLQDQSLDAP